MCMQVVWEWKSNKSLFYELECAVPQAITRATVHEASVAMKLGRFMQSMGPFSRFSFDNLSSTDASLCGLALNTFSPHPRPPPLKNRLIPLWHAICGGVIDFDFFFLWVLEVLQENFFLCLSHSLSFAIVLKQFPNKVFHPPIFQIVSHPIRVPKFYLRSAFTPFPFSRLVVPSCFLHQTWNSPLKRILITITKERKTFNASFFFSTAKQAATFALVI